MGSGDIEEGKQEYLWRREGRKEGAGLLRRGDEVVTNGKESRDTGRGEVDDLRSTVAYLATSSTAFPYGDSKACSLLELFGILLSPMSGVE